MIYSQFGLISFNNRFISFFISEVLTLLDFTRFKEITSTNGHANLNNEELGSKVQLVISPRMDRRTLVFKTSFSSQLSDDFLDQLDAEYNQCIQTCVLG